MTEQDERALTRRRMRELGSGVQRSRAYFDPDELHGQLEFKLPQALRGLADAIERGEVTGELAGFVPWGFQRNDDGRCHLLVKLHIAAPVRAEIVMDERRMAGSDGTRQDEL